MSCALPEGPTRDNPGPEVPDSTTRASSCSSSGEIILESARQRKKSSIASQVTFASLFGNVEDEDGFEDSSTDPGGDEDTIVLVTREPRLREFPRMEHIFYLYMLASALSRVNLKLVFRIKQCLSVLNLNAGQCEELFKLEDVKIDDLKVASDALIDARLGIEYLAGTIVVFLLSQYLVKYGLKHAVLFCLIGSLLSHVFVYVTIYFVDVDIYYTFVAALPLVLTGGDILMSTLACAHIGTTSMGFVRRSRFLCYHFCLLFPEMIAQLLNVHVLPNMHHVSFELWAIGILVFAIIISLFFSERYAEGFESHSVKQRIRCSLGFVNFKETVMCFSRKRPCRARVQTVFIISILVTTPFYFAFFSEVQETYMSGTYDWDANQFVTDSSLALVASFIFCLTLNWILAKFVRPLDPTIAVAGFTSLLVSYICLSTTAYFSSTYYGALTLMAMPILGFAALRSHLCQLLEKCEIAPVFALICSMEKVSRVAASRLWKVVLKNPDFAVDPVLIYICQASFAVLPLFATLFMVSTTRAYGYPTHLYNPAFGVY